MQLFITILVFLVIFSVLILVHECGHFFMAKRNGIKVEEFGFGLPPRIWGVKKGETLYSINWIPFGGFVRLLGENPHDKNAAKSKRSFSRKSLWQRAQVVCAGVVMNFLLAWLLLTIGFMVGMQPLVVDQSEFFDSVRDGRIEVETGVLIEDVAEGSWAEDNGFKKGDIVYDLNGERVTELRQLFEATQSEDGFVINSIPYIPVTEDDQAGFLFNVFEFPELTVASAGLADAFQAGDIIVSLNGETVFFMGDFMAIYEDNVGKDVVYEVEVLRGGEVIGLETMLPDVFGSAVAQVMEGSPAELAGLQVGDVVTAVNGVSITSPQEIVDIVVLEDSDVVVYDVDRDGEVLSFEMTRNEEGLVGVLLGYSFVSESEDVALYDWYSIVSVTNVEDQKYAWYEAPFQSMIEIQRISGYTAVSIAKVFGDIFTSGTVPEGVAGPVGIAQMTGFYIEEGVVALMRFTALLSLSLGVINIFPFPALDGGRLLFIVLEGVRGKPVDARVEGIIHSIGFFLLLAVIFLVTFKDIERLFGS
jgi:regulator of sigma E protease